MYLALIPDEQTLKALRAFAPALPPDAHCTIIHSKAPLPAGLRKPIWVCGTISVHSLRVAVFGFARKVQVLKLQEHSELLLLRQEATSILSQAQLPWSSEWAFSPHITLGGALSQLVGDPPALLRFDRMEWRP